MKKDQKYTIIFILSLTIVGLVMHQIGVYNIMSGSWSTISTIYFSVFAELLVMGFSLYILFTANNFNLMRDMLTGILLGSAFSSLLYTLNNSGILLDEYITSSLTITDLMAVVIIIFAILSMIIGMSRR